MPTSIHPLPQKERGDEKLLKVVLICLTLVYPGTISLAIAAYIAGWTQYRRLRSEYIALFFLCCISLSVLLLTANYTAQTVSEFVASVTEYNAQNALIQLTILWCIGIPIAPLLGVVMSIWRSISDEIEGNIARVNEYLQRGFHQEEQHQEQDSEVAAAHIKERPAARHGELLLGTKVGSWGRFTKEHGIVRQGEWIGLKDWVKNTHMLVVGGSGEGKTELLKTYIAETVKNTDDNIIFVDGKGDDELADTFRDIVWTYTKAKGESLHVPVFRLSNSGTGAKYDGFVGTAEAIQSRLEAMIGITDVNMSSDGSYYKQKDAMILSLICSAPKPIGPPRSFSDVDDRLDTNWLLKTYEGTKKGKALERLGKKGIEAAVQSTREMLQNTIWELEDVMAPAPAGFTLDNAKYSFFSLKTGGAGHSAKLLLKYLVEDLKDYMCNRIKVPTTVIIDEFGVLGANNIDTILFQGRSKALGVILATQGYSGLGDEETRERIIEGTRTKILMAVENPEPFAKLAGTVPQYEYGQQIENGEATGVGTIREQDAFAINMNEAAQLPRGEAFIMRKRRKQRIRVALVGNLENAPQEAEELADTDDTVISDVDVATATQEQADVQNDDEDLRPFA